MSVFDPVSSGDFHLMAIAIWCAFGLLLLTYFLTLVYFAFNRWFRTAVTILIVEDVFWSDPSAAAIFCPDVHEREVRMSNYLLDGLESTVTLSVLFYQSGDQLTTTVDRFSPLSPVCLVWKTGYLLTIEGTESQDVLLQMCEKLSVAASNPAVALLDSYTSTSPS